MRMGIDMKTQFAGFRFASDENLENAKLAEQRVFAEIKKLGLERNIEELDTQGFCWRSSPIYWVKAASSAIRRPQSRSPVPSILNCMWMRLALRRR